MPANAGAAQQTGAVIAQNQCQAGIGCYVGEGLGEGVRDRDCPADGEPAWENPEVNQINHISDFSLVLVITDNPETGRTWIEQIGPKLGGKPLVFVSSAQAAPILQPYYASQPQQLQGLITGVAGGMPYQESALFFLNNNQAGVPWSTYSLALWAGAAIVILGVIVAFIRRMNEEDSEPRSGGIKP